MVLDVDYHIRQSQVACRLDNNKADHFDRYLAGDGELSERIEAFLIWLAESYLGARVVMNNNLSDEEIIVAMPELKRSGGPGT